MSQAGATLGSRSIELDQNHIAWIRREQERQLAEETASMVLWKSNSRPRPKSPPPPVFPWLPDGTLRRSPPPPSPTPTETARSSPRRANAIPASRAPQKPPPSPPSPRSTTARRFDDFLQRQTQSHLARMEAIERGTQSPRVECAIDGNSERILRRMAPGAVSTAPVSPARENPPSPQKKLPAVVGERRLRLELAQEAVVRLMASAVHDELEAKRYKECTFSPKHESKPPRKRSPQEKRELGRKEEARPQRGTRQRQIAPIVLSTGEVVAPFTRIPWKKRARSVEAGRASHRIN
jgi:hypothetical protein